MIQYRYGDNSGWEQNHSNIVNGEPVVSTFPARHFIGTGATGQYMEVATYGALARNFVSTVTYKKGDVVVYMGKIYKCVTASSGEFNPSYWEQTTLGEYLALLLDMATEKIGA